MARPLNPDIREKLRRQAVDYVLSHGVGELALRPLAKALGTNARMLIYHFGSREGLMRDILEGRRELEDVHIQAWFKEGTEGRTLSAFLRWYWQRMSAPRARPAIRLVFELYALALRHPKDYPGVLEDPLAYWKGLAIKGGLVPDLDEAASTLLLAATRGLLLDLCATGDQQRVGNALQLLIQFAEARQEQAFCSIPKPNTKHAPRKQSTKG